MNLQTEKYYWKKGYKTIVGLDESGRGALAGPVVAAAVMINVKFKNKKSKPQIKIQNFREILKNTRDSKKLSPKQREEIFSLIKKCSLIQFSYVSVNEKVIDKINIEQATFKAMKRCVKILEKKENLKPDLLLIDGNRIIDNRLSYPQKTIIKGDDKIFSIALASIVAKVIRDRKMKKLSLQYPKYHFHQHKGYGTKLHKKLIKKYGPCEIHRKSYRLIK